MIIYWVVTSVYDSDESGGQLCSVKSNISRREYVDCEIISPSGLVYKPTVWDIVAFTEVNNSEAIVIWKLEQKTLKISTGETLVFSGTYWKCRIHLKPDATITLDSGETDSSGNYTSKCKIVLKPNGEIDMHATKVNVI